MNIFVYMALQCCMKNSRFILDNYKMGGKSLLKQSLTSNKMSLKCLELFFRLLLPRSVIAVLKYVLRNLD